MMLAAVSAFWGAELLQAQDPESLTEAQKMDFLRNAEVVNSRQLGKGTTGILRLTLSNGTITHDAAFQPVDQFKSKVKVAGEGIELGFRDSYKFNIAAYELAKMLGLGDMMPPTVERSWMGRKGALSWWLPTKMDERERLERRIQPPDPDAWNKQMHRMRVFVQLVYDTDRNLGNVLISEDWHLWMIDFTRAFRVFTSLENPESLTNCDRRLLEALRRLEAEELEQRTRGFLDRMEIKAVMARREKIVALFEKLVAKKGESQVLYD
jgi:hypothetical protein